MVPFVCLVAGVMPSPRPLIRLTAGLIPSRPELFASPSSRTTLKLPSWLMTFGTADPFAPSCGPGARGSNKLICSPEGVRGVSNIPVETFRGNLEGPATVESRCKLESRPPILTPIFGEPQPLEAVEMRLFGLALREAAMPRVRS